MINSFNLAFSNFLESSVNRIIFAFLGGLFLASSLPFIGFAFVAWIGLVPLFILIRSAESNLRLIKEVFIFGFIYNLISFVWLLNIHPVTWQGFSELESFCIALLAWILPSLYHSALIVVFALLAKLIFALNYNKQNILNSILIAFLWVIFEYKLAIAMPIFNVAAIPINYLAYSQYQNPFTIQIASAIGAIGLELMIVFVNLFFTNLVQFNKKEITTLHHLHIGESNISEAEARSNIAKFIAFILVGAVMLIISGFTAQMPTEEKVSYGIVQGNLSAENIRGSNLVIQDIVALHRSLSSKLKNNNQIIIWPEGSVPTSNRELARSSTKLDFINQSQTEFQSQNYNQEEIDESQQENRDKNLIIDSNINKSPIIIFGTYLINKTKNQIFNSIEVHESNTEKPSSFYHKKQLVPFGEYTPFLKILPGFLKELAKSAVGEGFSEGPKKQNAINTSSGKIGFSICFEILFPNLIREQVLSGAEYIINLSDLSWFRSDLIKKQFLAAAVFRAVENRRAILLASNSGYSALISPLGQILQISKSNSEDTIEGKVSKNSVLSIYSKYGW